MTSLFIDLDGCYLNGTLLTCIQLTEYIRTHARVNTLKYENISRTKLNYERITIIVKNMHLCIRKALFFSLKLLIEECLHLFESATFVKFGIQHLLASWHNKVLIMRYDISMKLMFNSNVNLWFFYDQPDCICVLGHVYWSRVSFLKHVHPYLYMCSNLKRL